VNGNFKNMFYNQSVKDSLKESFELNPCGGGDEYLHRDPASLRRRRKARLKSETVKYGHESKGTRTQEILRWRVPASYTRTDPSSRQRGSATKTGP
jgi:hypothetical protein